MKAEHAELVEKKSTLKSALCAARGTVTKFDQIANFWQDFVLEPEEREEQKRRRSNAKTSSSQASGLVKSRSESIVGNGCPIICGNEGQVHQQQFSSDDSSILSRHLLLLQPQGSQKNGGLLDASDPDRRDRCDSVMDVLKQSPMMPVTKPRPPVEINIDLEKVRAPVEEDAAAARTTSAFMV